VNKALNVVEAYTDDILNRENLGKASMNWSRCGTTRIPMIPSTRVDPPPPGKLVLRPPGGTLSGEGFASPGDEGSPSWKKVHLRCENPSL
jgi:hypothetical protein